MKTLYLDGMEYNTPEIEKLQGTIVTLRDAALMPPTPTKPPLFDWAVSLSHVHAVLDHYKNSICTKEELRLLSDIMRHVNYDANESATFSSLCKKLGV